MSNVRDRIRATQARVYPVPTVEGTFHIRAMSGARRDEYIQWLLSLDEGRKATQSEQCAWALWDPESNNWVYDPRDPDHIAELRNWDGSAIGACVQMWLVESGLMEKSVEQEIKKSEASPSTDSGIA
jgi:hypothetical protein